MEGHPAPPLRVLTRLAVHGPLDSLEGEIPAAVESELIGS
jgi:hypothetical protein